jgi:hypothetical protein
MTLKIRFPFDRRSDQDRRKAYNLRYFLEGGQERRAGKDRRLSGERRIDWIRVSDWSSVLKGLLDPERYLVL